MTGKPDSGVKANGKSSVPESRTQGFGCSGLCESPIVYMLLKLPESTCFPSRLRWIDRQLIRMGFEYHEYIVLIRYPNRTVLSSLPLTARFPSG